MKKLILSLFVILTVFTITACKKEEKKEEKNNNNQEQKEEVKTKGNSLVLYFSATGTTKKIAERILFIGACFVDFVQSYDLVRTKQNKSLLFFGLSSGSNFTEERRKGTIK